MYNIPEKFRPGFFEITSKKKKNNNSEKETKEETSAVKDVSH